MRCILNKTVTNWFAGLFSLLISKRTLVFLCFLLLAIVAWGIKRLSNEFRAQLVLNVCVYNSANDKAARWFSQDGLPVTGKATGFYIIEHRLNPHTVYVDLKKQKLRQSGERYYMLVSSLQNDIKQWLNNAMQVESYDCDTLFFYKVEPGEDIGQDVIYGGNKDNRSKSARGE